MSSLLKSRKFWIMVVDVIISSATYFISKYVAPEIGNDIIWLIASWQPVIYALIAGIAAEDAAEKSKTTIESIPWELDSDIQA